MVNGTAWLSGASMRRQIWINHLLSLNLFDIFYSWLHVDLKKCPRYVSLEEMSQTGNGHGEVYSISVSTA